MNTIFYKNYKDFKEDFYIKNEDILSGNSYNWDKEMFLKIYLSNYKDYLKSLTLVEIVRENDDFENAIKYDLPEFIKWLDDKRVPFETFKTFKTFGYFPLIEIEFHGEKIVLNEITLTYLDFSIGFSRGYDIKSTFNTHLHATEKIIQDLTDIYNYFIECAEESPNDNVNLLVLNNWNEIKEHKKKSKITTPDKLSVPQKIKIIDHLNIIPYLMEKKEFSKTNAEKIIAKLFDLSPKQVKNNLQSNLHSDFTKNIIEEIKNQPSKN